MCICRGDLRSPAGEHSSPLPCSENILMRTSLMRVDFFCFCFIYMCIRRGDLRSPAGEHSSPLLVGLSRKEKKNGKMIAFV